MHLSNFFQIPHPLFFLIILSATKIMANPLPSNCPVTTCGETEIRYPFWTLDNSTAAAPTEQYSYCGYSGFGIRCNPDTNESVIRLSSGDLFDDFYVSDIDYENYTIKLIDADITTNQNCPRARHNLTIDQRQAPLYLNSSIDFNLTFYFNCTSPVSWPYTYPLDCLQSGRNTSYLTLAAGNNNTNEIAPPTPWFDFCEEKVVTTVKETAWEELIKDASGISRFGRAMNEGFVLDWRGTIECYRCEISNGFCGFNTTGNGTDQFLCICDGGRTTGNSGICRKSTFPFYSLLILESLCFILCFLLLFSFGKKIILDKDF